jgi:carbon storage regulator
MLVLSRKADEWVDIGGDIHVVIVDIRGDRVRLGIEAPAEVPVTRPDNVAKEPSQSRMTLIQYIADLRRRFVAIQSCLDALDAGAPADEVVAGIREVTYAASH